MGSCLGMVMSVMRQHLTAKELTGLLEALTLARFAVVELHMQQLLGWG